MGVRRAGCGSGRTPPASGIKLPGGGSENGGRGSVLHAHNDNDPSEISIPGTRGAPRPWKRATPWAIAFAAHALLAALFLITIAQRGTERSAPEAIVVTLVERPSPDLAALVPELDVGPDASQAIAPDPEPDDALAAALPRDFAVNVAPRPGTTTLVLPRVPRFASAPREPGPLADEIRQTLAAAEVCRAFAPTEQIAVACPSVPDRSAEIQLAGLDPSDFLDPALAPPAPPVPSAPTPGTAEFELGPLAVSFTMFGSGPAPYRLTIKPRASHDKSLAAPPTVTAV